MLGSEMLLVKYRYNLTIHRKPEIQIITCCQFIQIWKHSSQETTVLSSTFDWLHPLLHGMFANIGATIVSWWWRQGEPSMGRDLRRKWMETFFHFWKWSTSTLLPCIGWLILCLRNRRQERRKMDNVANVLCPSSRMPSYFQSKRIHRRGFNRWRNSIFDEREGW